jgi:cellulose synthase/poly-beta-1,6-N-acetylglucosamine synthase-like glycosyltransferase
VPEGTTVVVPTFRRPASLARCLAALGFQTRPPDQVVVVVRDEDDETRTLLSTWRSGLRVDTVRTAAPGVVAALNAALTVVGGEIVAFVDDDTEPRPDWLARVVAHFAGDSTLGGLGGRDRQPGVPELPAGPPPAVGRLQWFGRTIGNHHLMTGPAREADILKGANMTYRGAAIRGLRFDERLRGTGAQLHYEMAFCFAVKRRGWKLVCDPHVIVDHYPAERFDEDARSGPSPAAVANAVHNETLVLLEHLGWWQRPVFAAWSVLLGTRAAPGLGQWVRLKVSGAGRGTPLGPSLRGRFAGWRSWILGPRRPPSMEREGRAS